MSTRRIHHPFHCTVVLQYTVRKCSGSLGHFPPQTCTGGKIGMLFPHRLHHHFLGSAIVIPSTPNILLLGWPSMPRLRGSALKYLLPLLLLACAVAVCECSVHEYRGERFVSRGNAFVIHGGSEGIVAPNSDKKESSFIWFDRVAFLRPKGNANFSSGSIQAVVFEVEDRETIGGSAYGGQREVCCTADLAKLGVCTQGQIIRRPSSKDPDWPRIFGVSFHKNKVATRLSTTKIPIATTGMYNLYFIHCDPNIRDLALIGKTVWKNPGGYLPGRMTPLMNFYGFMSPAFVVLTVFWFSQYARFWNEILQLQNCISLVIILGMFEMVMW
ncbi:hypothetical protein SAY86_026244 [Trapa natans]|uniref:GOST seven transmembrane domain-containing protein n=1 Tax=Trapa natans TaxID=22666 RepID=A0AAN7QEK5_TRANT|nr:hypothetical protein SAY86_026244 [Trapa natans]